MCMSPTPKPFTLAKKKFALTLRNIPSQHDSETMPDGQNIFQRGSSVTSAKKGEFSRDFFPASLSDSYLISEKIGQGNQAEIFKIQHKITEKLYAAKIYRSPDLEELTMIEKEARILKKLRNDNIIAYHEFLKDEKNDVFVLIMEFFPSMTLERFLEEHVISNEQKSSICKKILATLLYLHSQKIAHKDLNLSNILIDPISLQIKLIDFGLAVHDVKNDEIHCPEGNFSYRPPNNMEIFYDPYNMDLWCLHLVFLSVMLKKKVNTKKALSFVRKTDLLEELPDFDRVSQICANIGLFLEEKIPLIRELEEIL